MSYKRSVVSHYGDSYSFDDRGIYLHGHVVSGVKAVQGRHSVFKLKAHEGYDPLDALKRLVEYVETDRASQAARKARVEASRKARVEASLARDLPDA